MDNCYFNVDSERYNIIEKDKLNDKIQSLESNLVHATILYNDLHKNYSEVLNQLIDSLGTIEGELGRMDNTFPEIELIEKLTGKTWEEIKDLEIEF